MLHLIYGRAGAGKTAMILDRIRTRVLAREKESILIVPEQYSHEAERELARRCGDTMSLYAEVLSFTRLAHSVALEVGGSSRTYVDAGGRLLQLALALEQVSGALSVYNGAARQPELMVQLLAALDELRMGRATAETLRAAAEEAGGHLSAKLRDLSLLREALDAMEAQTGADPVSRLEVLAENIPQSERLRGAHIYIDGFTDFTAQERMVIRALWKTADVTVCLTCDDLHTGSEVFNLSRHTARRLCEDAAEDNIETECSFVPSRKSGTPLGFLEENLFGWTDEVMDAGDSIRLVTAPTVTAECELAAAEIKRLVRGTGCRWRDIAIAVRGFEDYRSTLETVFRRWEVPLYASARTDIFTRPLPALISAAFDILSDGWSFESMFTYLKTGLADISREECDELENYVLLWSLRGNAWTREAAWRQHPDGYNGIYTPEAEERLARLDMLRRRIAVPLQHLGERGEAASAALGQCRATADFWDEIGLPDRLRDRADALEAAGEMQTAAEYRQLWDVIVSALEQCAAVLNDMPMTQEQFARLFRRMLSQYDIGTIPVALDRVTAGDFDRMRRRSIRHLLVLGASDDRLPRVSDGSGVFTDPERDTLRTLHVELSDADDGLDREFSLIYNVLSLPGDSLRISRCAYTANGNESRKAFITERIERMFTLKERTGDLRDARRWAHGPAMELAMGGDAEARAWFAKDPEAARRMAELETAAQYSRGRLGRDAVRSLYGDKLWLTASRIDNFASCRFQYFLRYGLRAKPRQAADFAPPELGTFLHYLLENVARSAGEQGGFAALSDEQVNALTDRYVEEYIHREMNDFREKSARFIYLFRRLTVTARRIVLDTARELCLSDFRPLDFELNFSDNADMPPVALGEGEDALVLTGVADRVDGWEHDGKLYLRVVDYKSGVKSFSLTDVWYGMGLQMLLYLFTLQRQGKAHYGMPVVPAGVMYIPARDVLVSAKERLTDEDILKEKSKKLRRSGLVLHDEDVLHAMEHSDKPRYIPVNVNRQGEYTGDSLATAEQLAMLSRHVDDTLKKMAAELHRGSIAADPWFRSENENTCLRCDYFEACHFDEKADGWRYKSSLKAPEFWCRLADAQAEGGDTECR